MKFLKKVVAVLLLCCLFVSLVSCGGSNQGSDLSEESKDANNGVFFYCYLDSSENTVVVDDLEVQFNGVYESVHDNVSVDLTLKIKNITNETRECNIGDAIMYREETQVSYDAHLGFLDEEQFEIESALVESVSFSATIPSSYKSENYFFDVEINGKTLRFYLYITPDSARDSYTITYSIKKYGEIRSSFTTKVLEGKRANKYVWYSEDGLYYCDRWYYESDTLEMKEFDYYSTIESNVNLFGFESSILDCMTPGNTYVYIRGINVVPDGGVLYIPKTIDEKNVRLFPYFFNTSFSGTKFEDVTVVYIDIVEEISSIQAFDRTGIKTIYFAGTKEQWDAYNVTIPNNITVIYNTPYSK